jgi:hypothetical protein
MADTNQPDSVTVRRALPEDGPALQRLASLDSTHLPAGETLLAARGGRLLAALSIETGAVAADPFAPTAELVDLLRLRMLQLAEREAKPRGRRFKGLVGVRV